MSNINTSSTCSHNMVNFGPPTAEIVSGVWNTPANFNRFCILASLLHRRCSTEVNQTLHDVWPSPGVVHYIYIFGGSWPLTQFFQMRNSLCVQVLCSPIFAVLLHGTRVLSVSQTLRHSAVGATYIRQGGQSCWASAHILVFIILRYINRAKIILRACTPKQTNGPPSKIKFSFPNSTCTRPCRTIMK